MIFGVLPSPRVEAHPADTLRDLLIARKGEKSNNELAREIGISEGMIRAILNGTTLFGTDSLSALVNWNVGIFGTAVLQYLKARGQELVNS